jgi:hypothetical protein
MTSQDRGEASDHIPVEKSLSGDFGSPLEVLAARGLTPAQKREILGVWLKDLESQPDTDERRKLYVAIGSALESLPRSP